MSKGFRRYFNYISVRTFILYGAPFRNKCANTWTGSGSSHIRLPIETHDWHSEARDASIVPSYHRARQDEGTLPTPIDLRVS